eukprot:Nk52_evm1s2331 gene=Nk52_evmTU1s2331
MYCSGRKNPSDVIEQVREKMPGYIRKDINPDTWTWEQLMDYLKENETVQQFVIP